MDNHLFKENGAQEGCTSNCANPSFASLELEMVWNECSLNAIFSTLETLARKALQDWEEAHMVSPDADTLQIVTDLSALGKKKLRQRVALETSRQAAGATNKGADITALDEGGNDAVQH